MQDLMLINNVLYALKECPEPVFLLKSDIEKALEEGPVSYATIRECIQFNGKYYAYHKVKQKENEQAICEADNGYSREQ
jgi:hypothetical protein